MKKILILILMMFVFVGVGNQHVQAEDPIVEETPEEITEPTPEEIIEETCTGLIWQCREEVYDGEYVTDEGTYKRISYDSVTEKWYGVVEITDKRSEYYEIGGYKYNTIYVNFSRDLERLEYLSFIYTTEAVCNKNFGDYLVFWADSCSNGLDIGELVSTEVYEIFVEQDLGNEDIAGYIAPNEAVYNSDYAWKIPLWETRPIDVIVIIEIGFVLTDAEMVQLGLDIQSQFEYEAHQISINNEFNTTRKALELEELKNEYEAIPELNFGMYFAEICPVGDESCIIIAEDSSHEVDGSAEYQDSLLAGLDDVWEWPTFDGFGDWLWAVVKAVGLAVIGAFSAVVVGYMVAKKLIEFLTKGSVKVTTGFFKTAKNTGDSVLKNTGKGISYSIKSINKGLEEVFGPLTLVFYVIVIGIFALIFII